MIVDEQEHYRRWRAPEALGRRAVDRFVAEQRGAERSRMWLPAAVAALFAVVALLNYPFTSDFLTGPDTVAGTDSALGQDTRRTDMLIAGELRLAALTLAAIKLPPKPDFPTRAEVSLPAEKPSIPGLGALSLFNLTIEENR